MDSWIKCSQVMQHKAYCLAQVNTSTKLRSTKKREHAHEKKYKESAQNRNFKGSGVVGVE